MIDRYIILMHNKLNGLLSICELTRYYYDIFVATWEEI